MKDLDKNNLFPVSAKDYRLGVLYSQNGDYLKSNNCLLPYISTNSWALFQVAQNYYYMQDLRHLTIEKIILIMMDSKSRLIKDMTISSGTVNASILAPREIFVNALKYEAVNIIILHNHPSGDPTPSNDDIYSTKRIKEAGNLIGIKLMDHIIIGDNRYVSLKERGLF